MASFRPLCPDALIPDPGADYRAADRAEQFRMGAEALYLPAFPGTKYLPYAAVRRAWLQSASLPLTGCCGKELPMTVLRTELGDGFFQNFSFEKRESAERVLARIREKNPSAGGQTAAAEEGSR